MRRKWLYLLMTGLMAVLFAAAPMISAADTEYEYEPGEGLHEEEWYDPSDWFNDDDDIDYEDDYGTYGYDYDYYDDYWDYGYTEPDVYDEDLGDDWDYEYQPYLNEYSWEYEPYEDFYTEDWYDTDDEFSEWYDNNNY